ncbi:hypothetical protein [Noviherbaspirillum suwonense]|uniref:hypothetical protein n=1 Tax=Noviherbaspirillum suwonense TaxID=1224511 RepID=UPI0024B6CF20|nr:hypothetical protein [Noviherbaspirillum suwonense]
MSEDKPVDMAQPVQQVRQAQRLSPACGVFPPAARADTGPGKPPYFTLPSFHACTSLS